MELEAKELDEISKGMRKSINCRGTSMFMGQRDEEESIQKPDKNKRRQLRQHGSHSLRTQES
jgi:hypothetical protein